MPRSVAPFGTLERPFSALKRGNRGAPAGRPERVPEGSGTVPGQRRELSQPRRDLSWGVSFEASRHPSGRRSLTRFPRARVEPLVSLRAMAPLPAPLESRAPSQGGLQGQDRGAPHPGPSPRSLEVTQARCCPRPQGLRTNIDPRGVPVPNSPHFCPVFEGYLPDRSAGFLTQL